MNIESWIPATATSALLAFVLWLLRSVIATRLTKSVQHEFDEKMEQLRTNLRNSEESFKADLRAKDTQIEILRSGALSGLVSRQAALDRRRIEAVDQIWSAVIALAPAKVASSYMKCLKFEEAVKYVAKNPQFKSVFESFGKLIDLNKFEKSHASQARPFVSQMAWALYSAYEAILTYYMLQFKMVEDGIDTPGLLNKDSIAKLVTTALPHQKDFIQQYGDQSYHFLFDELESRLLEELQNILKGTESNKENVEQAAKILKESERVMEEISKSNPLI